MFRQHTRHTVTYPVALLLCCFLALPFCSFCQDEPEEELVEIPLVWTSKDGDSMVQSRKVSPESIHRLKEDDAFWYAKGGLKKKEVELDLGNGKIPFYRQSWFQTLIWLVIIGSFAGALMWFLAENDIGLFRRKPVAIPKDEFAEDITDIYSINYQKEIDKAIRDGNFRTATRLMYLRLLKDLSEKNIINYSQERTNLDYLHQLSPTRYYNGFFKVTRNYEYSWYGQFEVDEVMFRAIQQDFNQFNRQFS